MPFWLKKALTVPLMPLTFALLVGTLGAILLFRPRFARRGRILVVIALLVLGLASNKGVALWLIAPLELRHAAIPELAPDEPLPAELSRCRAVVVLGGGHGDTASLSRINQLSASALSRLAEGIRLLRLLPADVVLVVSGHNGSKHPSHAQILAEAAISLGVPASRILRCDTPRDTESEVSEIKARFGDEPVAVVTSAWHMPRAIGLCERAQVNAFPCPADFTHKPGADSGVELFAWNLEALGQTSKAIRERVGQAWNRVRGK